MNSNQIQTDSLFDCHEKHEFEYIIGTYSYDKQNSISNLLSNACNNGELDSLTYQEIYELIENKLGYAIPAKIQE